MFRGMGIYNLSVTITMPEYPPMYQQSYGYSCGPASLLMVLGAIDKNLKLTESLEVDVWEDANLVESRATSSYGLALAALRRGFKAKVYADGDGIGFTRRLKDHFPQIDVSRMDDLFQRTKNKARKFGVEEILRTATIEDIREELKIGAHPIVLISTRMMWELRPIPHWIVVISADDGVIKIQNPETARIETYKEKRFKKYMGFEGQMRMVCIYPSQ
jgi:ABC-type bacteriocin/lantibiotic exporter with double-glycine peptidase domain